MWRRVGGAAGFTPGKELHLFISFPFSFTIKSTNKAYCSFNHSCVTISLKFARRKSSNILVLWGSLRANNNVPSCTCRSCFISLRHGTDCSPDRHRSAVQGLGTVEFDLDVTNQSVAKYRGCFCVCVSVLMHPSSSLFVLL